MRYEHPYWARVSWRTGDFINMKLLPLDIAEEKKAKLHKEGVRRVCLDWPVNGPIRKEDHD